MKAVYRLLFALHLLVGTGAMAGGLGPILNPLNPMGMTVADLKNSPFDSFLIPGLFLFVVNGLGNLICSIAVRRRWKSQAYMSFVIGWVMVFWITIQCVMLEAVVFLHILFFFIGIVQVVLSVFVMFDQLLPPANIIVYFYKRIKREP